ncbi:MAG: hypothetical protein U9N03_04540 [Candidatus Caldatribacteriota bacterium]|nr:hypothetical protein [Candidatus Caldatribacteriota bacterium]
MVFNIYLSAGFLSRGKEKGKEKERKEQCTHRAKSNLPVEALPERERVLLFVKQGKNIPRFIKSNTRDEKANKKHNTQKITQI